VPSPARRPGAGAWLDVPRLTDADLETLASLFEALHGARGTAPATPPADDGAAVHEQFHFLIFERADSPRLLRYVIRFWRSAHLFRLLSSGGAVHLEETRPGHQALLDACRRGDADAAVEAMAAHRADTLAGVLARMTAD
jgi:DNA-binding GntR family transcriptional regulator